MEPKADAPHSAGPILPAGIVGSSQTVLPNRPYILLEVLKRWGTRTTGEILNYVYFQTEPMEAAIRNQPLDFSLIATERPAVYSRSSSGKSPADIRKLRAKFEHQQAEKKAKEQRPFTFTPPLYDEEYFEAMGKLQTA